MTITRPITVLSGSVAAELLCAAAVISALAQSPAQITERVRTATWGPAPLMLPPQAGIDIVGDETEGARLDHAPRLSPGVRGFVLMPADADHCTQGETTLVRDGRNPVEFACVKRSDDRRRSMSTSAGR